MLTDDQPLAADTRPKAAAQAACRLNASQRDNTHAALPADTRPKAGG